MKTLKNSTVKLILNEKENNLISSNDFCKIKYNNFLNNADNKFNDS